jgi:hypothetical protein
MLTEDVLTRKKLGCVDLVIIVLSLDKAGVKYRINNDGSLSVFNVSFALVRDFDDHKTSGYIGDVRVDGYFDVINYHTRVDLVCNKYSRRIALDS